MKLKQTEYCHNCDQQVEFVFEDTEMKQIINCPVCGHEHYRELDGGTIISIRADMAYSRIRIVKISEIASVIEDSNPPTGFPEVEYEDKKVIGHTEDGRVIVEGGDNMRVSNRRWGQDRSQRR